MKKIILMVLVSGYVVLVFLQIQLPDNRFHVYFLDVDQGDSVFLKTPGNHQILVDGGPRNFVIEELGDVMPFFDKSIDLMILTHPHEDHIAGLVEVLKRFDVQSVLITGVLYENYSYKELLKEIKNQDIPIYFASSDDDFVFGEVYVNILFPFDVVVGQSFENVNNSSIAMKVNYQKLSILLTGDLEIESESKLVEANLDLKADIFKAGHHGSRTSSSWNFLKKILPKTVVIQCGKENDYNHPHPETLRNYHRIGVENIYRNDLDGRVEFVF